MSRQLTDTQKQTIEQHIRDYIDVPHPADQTIGDNVIRVLNIPEEEVAEYIDAIEEQVVSFFEGMSKK